MPAVVSKTILRRKAPKWGNRVDIYDEANKSLLIASLNLDKLGWQASWKRHWGKCNDIYVMELPDATDQTPSHHAAAAAA